MRSSSSGRCCLRGVLLGVAQLGDCDGQRDQVGDQCHGDQGGVAGGPAGQRHQPGRGAEMVSLTGGGGDLPVAGAGGVAVAVRGAAQFGVPQGPRRDVQRIGGPS
jgi:hypothetical protein